MKNRSKSFTLLTILSLSFATIGNALEVPDHDEGWHSNRPMLLMQERAEEQVEAKKNALKMLDTILSPFEDMIEYSLQEDQNKMQDSLQSIYQLEKSTTLKESINGNTYQKLQKEIQQLNHFVATHNYTKSALLSTSIFKLLINNFLYKDYIEEQIHIEQLDAMGFAILTQLKLQEIPYADIANNINNAQEHWLKIKSEIDNENLTNAFDLMLDGLYVSARNKDKPILKILAAMDLALVDLVEKEFR